MDKFEKALIDVALQSRRLVDVNKRISAALSASYEAQVAKLQKDWNNIPILPDDWEETWQEKNQHLKNAYDKSSDGFGGWYFTNHDDDVRGYLAEHCIHALSAHDLLQERREIRKAVGIAKRRVTFFANRLLDSLGSVG